MGSYKGDDIKIPLLFLFHRSIDKYQSSQHPHLNCLLKVKYMKVFTKKVIPIFVTLLTLLTLFIIIPSCTLASNQNTLHSPGSGESFDQMKVWMTESVNNSIGILGNSKASFTNESSFEAAEKLITDLKSIQEELSYAETKDELIKIKQELDTLFAAAPEELKGIPGLFPQNMGPRPGMQNGNENVSQAVKNGSEMSPEMMNNRSQPPEMMNGSQPRDSNTKANGSKMPGQGLAGMEKNGNITEENNNETTDGSSFFEKVISFLKSLFS
jgi:hypothetical protein